MLGEQRTPTLMLYQERSVGLVLNTLHTVVDPTGDLYYDWAVITLAKLSPILSVSAAALNEDDVWQRSRRSAVMTQVPDLARVAGRFNQVNPGELQTKSGRSLSLLISEARAAADSEGSGGLREWHVIKAILDTDSAKTLQGLGIVPEALLTRVGQLEGRVALGPADANKTWCFCDANVFLQYRLFDQVDWAEELDCGFVVLVVPTAVLRTLDRYKSDREHPRQQKRARQVLPLLGQYALSRAAGELAPIRARVELLLRDAEPRIPSDYDANDPDDRIVADATDFRWKHPGAKVVVLSGDYTVRLKARSAGLKQAQLPDHLELESYKPKADDA